LRVEILDGKDLKAMDRNGYSDPYAVIELNGEKIFKTATKKKTLKPQWNESTEFAVPSRTAAQCLIKVYDWDAVGSADKLGQARLDLAALEPFTSSTVTAELHDPNTGEKAGLVNVRMVFRPEFLNRARAATSTFSGATRVGTGLVGAGKGVVGGGGKIVGRGISGAAYRATHGGHGRSASVVTSNGGNESFDASQSMGIPPVPVTPSKFSAMDGTLKITVLNAQAGEEKAHVGVKQDGKSVDRSHEAFTLRTGKGPDVLEFALLEKKAFGRGAFVFSFVALLMRASRQATRLIESEPLGAAVA
jgi:hypothetical protein